jgi:hypothetical protein
VCEPLVAQIDHWKEAQTKKPIELTWAVGNDSITFSDSRFSDTPMLLTFGRLHKLVYEACFEVRSIKTITEIHKKFNSALRGSSAFSRS